MRLKSLLTIIILLLFAISSVAQEFRAGEQMTVRESEDLLAKHKDDEKQFLEQNGIESFDDLNVRDFLFLKVSRGDSLFSLYNVLGDADYYEDFGAWKVQRMLEPKPIRSMSMGEFIQETRRIQDEGLEFQRLISQMPTRKISALWSSTTGKALVVETIGEHVQTISLRGYLPNEITSGRLLIEKAHDIKNRVAWCSLCLQALRKDEWEYERRVVKGNIVSMSARSVFLVGVNGSVRSYEIRKFSPSDQETLWGYSRAHVLRTDPRKIDVKAVVISRRQK